MNLSGLKIKLKVNSMFIFYYPEYKTNTDLPTVTLSLYTKNFKEKKLREIKQSETYQRDDQN